MRLPEHHFRRRHLARRQTVNATDPPRLGTRRPDAREASEFTSYTVWEEAAYWTRLGVETGTIHDPAYAVLPEFPLPFVFEVLALL